MVSSTVEETASLVGEIQKVFEADQDVETIKKIASHINDAKEVKEKGDLQTKELIKEMTKRVEAARKNSSRTDEKLSNAQHLEKLLVEKQKLESEIKQLDAEKRTVKENGEDIKTERTKVDNQIAELESEIVDEVPFVKNSLSLYMNVTSLKWDFDCPLVRGHVTNNGTIKSFDLDANKMSKIELADKLWETIAA